MSLDSLIAKKPHKYYLELDKRLGSSKHKSAVSLTRDKNLNTSGLNLADSSKSELNVIFVLNADKVKQKYKVEPFNYDALDRYSGPQPTKNKESEERVMTDRIHPLHRFILNVEYRGNNPEIIKAIDDYENYIQAKKEEVKKDFPHI